MAAKDVKISLEITSPEETLEKVKRLAELLQEIQQIVDSLFTRSESQT